MALSYIANRMTMFKKNFIVLFFLCMYTIGFVSAQDLRKLPPPERERMILKIAKDGLLKYTDEEYNEACLTPKITTEVMPDGIYKGQEFYVVTYPYDTTKYEMDRDYAVQVKIFPATGKIFFMHFGDTWSLNVELHELKSYKTEKFKIDETMHKEWRLKVDKMWAEVKRQEELSRVAYDARQKRIMDSVRRARNFVVDLRPLSDEECQRVLLKLADEAVLRYGAPEYFAACLSPTITSDTMPYGDNVGREYYTVTYPYDTTQYIMPRDYAAVVEIWKDSGVVYYTYFGNGESIIGVWYYNDDFEPDRMPFDESFRKK